MTTLVDQPTDAATLGSIHAQELAQRLKLSQPPWVSSAMPDSYAIADCLLQSLQPRDRVLDVGCGTGCISLALCLHGFDVTGCDLSDAAVRTARRNASRHELTASFLQSDLLDNIEGTFDAIVFNPPYGFTADNAFWNLAKNLARRIGPIRRTSGASMPEPVRRFQRMLIKRFFRQAPTHLSKNGSLWVHTYQTQRADFLQVAPPHTAAVWIEHPAFRDIGTALLRITPA